VSLLSVRDLHKSYKSSSGHIVSAVANASFDLDAGTTLAIVGESGAGKSTLGRLVLRLIEPDAGAIVLAGENIRDFSKRRLRAARGSMQMVFQDPYSSLDPRRTIEQSIEEPLILHTGLSRRDRRSVILGLMDRVGLSSALLSRRPNLLSGGQLQRVSIARALAVKPRLIVCDEPVAALDISVRAQVLNLLLEIQRADDVALLFITHDMSTVRAMADQLAVMRSGVIVDYGPTDDVVNSPTSEYTRELLDAIPQLQLG
jgi:ABC-type glutathione transport system ATPase component